MNQHSFHIEYNNGLKAIHQKAINNVFDNFYYFLGFNDFSFESINFSVGTDDNSTFKISSIFLKNLVHKKFNHTCWFDKQALIIEEGEKDYIGTCFYMINALQEYANQEEDQLGRFQYKHSYQAKFSCVEDNLVLSYFQEIALVIFKQKIPLKPSDILLSHDIDFLKSGWKSAIKTAAKNFNLSEILSIGFNKIKGKDSQQNIEEILQIEKKHNIGSIFFFLTKKGSTPFKNISNSDYDIDSNYVQNCLDKIKQSPNHLIGLHKAINPASLADENIALKAEHNRFHYLAFRLPEAFEKLSKSTIKHDHSLGFSEKIGFRNSYGLSFIPYNPIDGEYYDFWEHPLTIMDSSLHYYMGMISNEEKYNFIKKFFVQNRFSSDISILWHNNFFQNEAYQKILVLINKIKHKSES